MRKLRVEIQGIAGIEDFLIRTQLERQLASQHVDELDSGVLVNANPVTRNGAEIRVVGIEFAIRGQEIERLEIKRNRVDTWSFGKAQTFFLAGQRENVPLAFTGEEVVKPNTEDESDARERRKCGVQFSVLKFGNERGRKPGVAGQFDQTHFAAQPEMFEFVADMIGVQRFP